jgi:hypothetical protein
MKSFVVATLVALTTAQASDYYELGMDDDFSGSTATTTSDGWGVSDTTPADPAPADPNAEAPVADPNDVAPAVDPNDVTPAVEPT